MVSKPSSYPLPKKGKKHPVYITKVISLNKICFRLVYYMEEYVILLKTLQDYFSDNYDNVFIGSIPENLILDHLFILKRNNVYHRVKVLEIWPNKLFLVRLIDEGFETIANANELLVNTNDKFLSQPSQGFTLPLHIDESLNNNKNLYLINYGLQKMTHAETNFFISLSSDNKIDLFFKDRKQNILSVNNFVTEYIKQTENIPTDKMGILPICLSSHVEAFKNGTLLKLYRVKIDIPKFVLPESNSDIEGEGEWIMKCKHVFNPNDFYLKLPKDKKFIDFVEDMNNYYENCSTNATDIAVDELYITNYGGMWTRLLILNSTEKRGPKLHTCLLFDKGYIGTIKEEDIFELGDRFKLEPPRTVKSSLAFVRPIQESWTKEACQFFRQQVKDIKFNVCPISTGADGIFNCVLLKENSDNKMNISDLLVEYEYALIDLYSKR